MSNLAYTITDMKWVPGTHSELMAYYLCDSDDDFASLPTAIPGSKAVSADTGNGMIVNASGQWVPFVFSSGSSGGSGGGTTFDHLAVVNGKLCAVFERDQS